MMTKTATLVATLAALQGLGAAQDAAVVKDLYNRLEDNTVVNDQCHPGGSFSLTSGETIPPCVAEQFFSSFCERVSQVTASANATSKQWAVYSKCLFGKNSSFRQEQKGCLRCKRVHNQLSQERHDWFAKVQELAYQDQIKAEHPKRTAWISFQANADWNAYNALPAGSNVAEKNQTVEEYYQPRPAQQRIGDFTINNVTYPGPDFGKRAEEILKKPIQVVDVPLCIEAVEDKVAGNSTAVNSTAGAPVVQQTSAPIVPTTLVAVPSSSKVFVNSSSSVGGSVGTPTGVVSGAATGSANGKAAGSATGLAKVQVALSITHAIKMQNGAIDYACIIGQPQKMDQAPKPVTQVEEKTLKRLPAQCQACQIKVSANIFVSISRQIQPASQACDKALQLVQSFSSTQTVQVSLNVKVAVIQQLTGTSQRQGITASSADSSVSGQVSVGQKTGACATGNCGSAPKVEAGQPGQKTSSCTTGDCGSTTKVEEGQAGQKTSPCTTGECAPGPKVEAKEPAASNKGQAGEKTISASCTSGACEAVPEVQSVEQEADSCY